MGQDEQQQAARRSGADVGAVLGLLLGVAIPLLAWTVFERGRFVGLLQPSPILIVFGGTAAGLLMAHSGGLGATLAELGAALRWQSSAGDTTHLARGAVLLRDTARFALWSGAVTLLLGLMASLGELDGTRETLGEHLAISLTGVVWALAVAIPCFALSANLARKAAP